MQPAEVRRQRLLVHSTGQLHLRIVSIWLHHKHTISRCLVIRGCDVCTKNSQQLVREVMGLLSVELWGNGCQLMSTTAAVKTESHSRVHCCKQSLDA